MKTVKFAVAAPVDLAKAKDELSVGAHRLSRST
jgi:hypothetical protein